MSQEEAERQAGIAGDTARQLQDALQHLEAQAAAKQEAVRVSFLPNSSYLITYK